MKKLIKTEALYWIKLSEDYPNAYGAMSYHVKADGEIFFDRRDKEASFFDVPMQHAICIDYPNIEALHKYLGDLNIEYTNFDEALSILQKERDDKFNHK
tara:strand:- start:623 stop:919 length:297 start_codon:yes stop_codon:yes gene_type:complete